MSMDLANVFANDIYTFMDHMKLTFPGTPKPPRLSAFRLTTQKRSR